MRRIAQALLFPSLLAGCARYAPPPATAATASSDSHVLRLRVTQVGGRDLTEPVELDFVRDSAEVELPRDVRSEPGYVGRHVHLIVYETGEFSGYPTRGLDGYGTSGQSRAFHFWTSLVVLAEAPSLEGR